MPPLAERLGRAAETLECVALLLRAAGSPGMATIAGPGLANVLDGIARDLLDLCEKAPRGA